MLIVTAADLREKSNKEIYRSTYKGEDRELLETPNELEASGREDEEPSEIHDNSAARLDGH